MWQRAAGIVVPLLLFRPGGRIPTLYNSPRPFAVVEAEEATSVRVLLTYPVSISRSAYLVFAFCHLSSSASLPPFSFYV